MPQRPIRRPSKPSQEPSSEGNFDDFFSELGKMPSQEDRSPASDEDFFGNLDFSDDDDVNDDPEPEMGDENDDGDWGFEDDSDDDKEALFSTPISKKQPTPPVESNVVRQSTVTPPTKDQQLQKRGLAGIIQAIKDDLTGKSGDSKAPINYDDNQAPVDEPESETNRSKPKSKNKRKNDRKAPNTKKALKLLFTPYKKVTNLLFKVIAFVLTLLSRIPIVGKVFKPALAATRILNQIALILPIVLVPLVIYWVGSSVIPSGNETVELPDNGSVSITQSDYANDSIVVTLANNGDVVATNVLVSAKLHSWNPQLASPSSWILWKPDSSCESTEAPEIDIDSQQTMTIPCHPAEGWFAKPVVYVSSE